MHKKLFAAIFVLFLCLYGPEAKAQNVFTSDIDHFWIAYDSIRSTRDSLKQIAFIKNIYIKKGTPGLKAFMLARDYTPELWVKLIKGYPKFWNSVRPNTLAAKDKSTEIDESIRRFKQLYPQLKEAKMYFTIGGLRSGGTTTGSMVLIGTEIATGDTTTDVSEFPNKWLEGVFKDQSIDNVVALNIHEYVHTQQNGEGENLLAGCIKEGACDFITELVMQKPMQNNYIKYGLQHEVELKEAFKKDMFSESYANWLYNGSQAKTMADLGYFMGYSICKAYYNQEPGKSKAIRDIIEVNCSREDEVEAFLAKSKYYNEPLDKAALIAAYEMKRPVVTGVMPFHNGDTNVDGSLQEMAIIFSQPMSTDGYSFNNSKKRKEDYPITGVIGFSDDHKTIRLKIKLQPAHQYEFIVTANNFVSEEGSPLKADYMISFKTK